MSGLAVGREAADASGDDLLITAENACAGNPGDFLAWLDGEITGTPPARVRVERVTASRGLLLTVSLLRPYLADTARLAIADADFAAVYEALVDVATIHPEFRFTALELTGGANDRAGRCVAELMFQRGRTVRQNRAAMPANKNRALLDDRFAPAAAVMPLATAEAMVNNALAKWQAGSREEAAHRFAAMEREFPDGESAQAYWHDAAGRPFTSFFTWGHDHDFGFGHVRKGAMGSRHVEIVSESLAFGLLPVDLHGADILDVGCWTGGDVLALAGLGAKVTAIEEHPVSARAAQRLCELVGADATVMHRSLYDDRPDWAQRFDVVYCAGVVYHVTDPLLLLRICFACLKPGGTLVVETKAESGVGAGCAYAGTMEKGWNWYSPTCTTLGRWLVDAGFPPETVLLHWRPVGRLLAAAVKTRPVALPDAAGFSRIDSWLARET